jgi:hypothetical protein
MATTPGGGGLEFDPAAAGGAGGSTTRGSAQGPQVQGAHVCMLVCLPVGCKADLDGPLESAIVRRMPRACSSLVNWHAIDEGCILQHQTAGATAGGGYSGPPKLIIFGGEQSCVSLNSHGTHKVAMLTKGRAACPGHSLATRATFMYVQAMASLAAA